ncbi:MAG TPA: ParB/RepB/Spo0J family partition protein [Oceanipulchritudo sp.]|nr:ParB/RepB/Spo0J family partition protein [Oceanipulchritudo sp.]
MSKKTGLGRGLGSLISGGITPPPATAKESNASKAKVKKVASKKPASKPAKPAKPASKKSKPSKPSTANKPVPAKAGVATGTTVKKETPPSAIAEDTRQTAVGLYEIPITRILPNPHQPRRDFHEESLGELAESIRAEGLLQPVVVRRRENMYELIAGERRWRACQKLKLKFIPARVIEATETSSAILSLIENLQRENLNPIEEAMGYASLIKDFDLTQEQVSERVGRSRASVANALRLLQLPREVQAYLIKGHLSVGHAKVLLGVEDGETRLLLARQSIERGWSVREIERQVERFKGRSDRTPKTRGPLPADEERAIDDLQKQLSNTLSTRVMLRHTPKKGRIIIEYYGNDDLQRIIEQMGMH